jgi:hypothetical protein
MTNGYEGSSEPLPGGGWATWGPDQMRPEPDPALDVRAEMERSVTNVNPSGDLLSAVRLRADRIRLRRRLRSGVAMTLSAAAVGTAPLASTQAPLASTGRGATPEPPSSGPSSGGLGRPASETAPASPWGATRIDDDFARSALDRSLWTVYEGAGDRFGRWSASDVAMGGGALVLSVSRTRGDPPSSWGGVGALGASQRYGRWEVRLRMSVGRGVIGQFVLSPVPGTTADPSSTIVLTVSPYQHLISVSGNGTGAGGERTATLRRPGDYHTVAVEWEPERVRVLLDGARLFEWTDGRLPVPLWPALQTIMAGPDCGSTPPPVDCEGTTTSFPQRLTVDWIRVRAYTGRR